MSGPAIKEPATHWIALGDNNGDWGRAVRHPTRELAEKSATSAAASFAYSSTVCRVEITPETRVTARVTYAVAPIAASAGEPAC